MLISGPNKSLIALNAGALLNESKQREQSYHGTFGVTDPVIVKGKIFEKSRKTLLAITSQSFVQFTCFKIGLDALYNLLRSTKETRFYLVKVMSRPASCEVK